MKLLVVNGPNINMIGIREPEIYGSRTYEDLKDFIYGFCDSKNIQCDIFQSNSEGEIIDIIQNAYNKYHGLIINAGGYSHTSIAIMDAIKAIGIKAAEVHLTDTDTRESFRKVSFVGMACEATFKGKGFESYKEAIEYFLN